MDLQSGKGRPTNRCRTPVSNTSFHCQMTGLRPRHAVLVRRINKGCEKRVRSQRLRLELRMELTAQEPWMVREFDDLNEVLVRRNTGNNEAIVGEGLLELAVKLVSMTMPFGNDSGFVNAIRE